MYQSSMQRLAAASVAVILAGSGALLAASPAGAASPTTLLPAAKAGPAAAKPGKAAAEPKGKVVSRTGLSIRSAPTTNSTRLGVIPSGKVIALYCKKVGQNVDGNKLWYLLGAGRPGYVSARYVQNLSPVPYCK